MAKMQLTRQNSSKWQKRAFLVNLFALHTSLLVISPLLSHNFAHLPKSKRNLNFLPSLLVLN